MAQGQEQSSGLVVTSAQAAQLLMITPPEFKQLAQKGWVTALDHDRYPLLAVVQGYLRFVRAELVSDNDIRLARKREIDQRVAIKERALIAVADHQMIIAEGFGGLVAELAQVGQRAAGLQLTGGELAEAIRADIENALHRTADRLDQAAARLGLASEPAAGDALTAALGAGADGAAA
jgi:hypothetical protein